MAEVSNDADVDRRRRRAGRQQRRLLAGHAPGSTSLLLEKTTFPREKVCGDGLTPRGTRALVEMGIDVSEEAGWLHNRGLRVIGGGQRLHLDWPELTSFPRLRPRPPARRPRRRCSPARRSRPAPGCTSRPPSPSRSSTTTGRVVGVHGRTRRQAAGQLPRAARAHLRGRVAASSPSALGVHRNDKRPLGVAVRRYYTSPKTHDDYLESWLELWDGVPERVQPAARLRLDLRHGRRHGQRRPRRAQLQRRVPEDRLPRRCSPAGSTTRPRSGACARRTPPARPAAPRCRWASTAPRTTRAACCWSATAAARSTRSTARASRTRWSPGRFAAEAVVQALARPAGAEPRARAARPTRTGCVASGARTTGSAGSS